MKLRKLALLPAAAAAIAFGTPAMANTLLFDGVTFETFAVDSNTLQLSILGLESSTGGWADATGLKAFELKNLGGAEVTSATVQTGPGVPNWNPSYSDALSANGCENGGTTGACFTIGTPVAVSDSMIWTIDFGPGAFTFAAPHLKVLFVNDAGNKVGDLFSRDIPAIPEPETYAMMLVGFSLLGFVARRRKQSLGNVVPV
jgi:hypothetical protein